MVSLKENTMKTTQESELQYRAIFEQSPKGLLHMCAWCRKVRDDHGYWKKDEVYIRDHSEASFTHGICPDCLKKESPETYEDVFNSHNYK